MRFLDPPQRPRTMTQIRPILSSLQDDGIRDEHDSAEDAQMLESAIACDHAVQVADFTARRVRGSVRSARLHGFSVDETRAAARTLELALQRMRSPAYRPKRTTLIGHCIGWLRDRWAT